MKFILKVIGGTIIGTVTFIIFNAILVALFWSSIIPYMVLF